MSPVLEIPKPLEIHVPLLMRDTYGMFAVSRDFPGANMIEEGFKSGKAPQLHSPEDRSLIRHYQLSGNSYCGEYRTDPPSVQIYPVAVEKIKAGEYDGFVMEYTADFDSRETPVPNTTCFVFELPPNIIPDIHIETLSSFFESYGDETDLSLVFEQFLDAIGIRNHLAFEKFAGGIPDPLFISYVLYKNPAVRSALIKLISAQKKGLTLDCDILQPLQIVLERIDTLLRAQADSQTLNPALTKDLYGLLARGNIITNDLKHVEELGDLINFLIAFDRREKERS